MLSAHDALALDRERPREGGLGKSLAPDLALQQAGQLQRHIPGFQGAVGFNHFFQVGGTEKLARYLFERLGELRQVLFGDGQPRSGGVAAEAQDQVRVALGHQVQGVAQMKSPIDRPEPLISPFSPGESTTGR